MARMATYDVYVQNLPVTCTCDMLYEEFSSAGKIVDVCINPCDNKSSSYTYGFLSFKSLTEAKKAVAHGEQATLGGRKLKTELSRRTTKAVFSSSQTIDTRQKPTDLAVAKEKKSINKEDESSDLTPFPNIIFGQVEGYAKARSRCESTLKAYKFFAEPGCLHTVKESMVMHNFVGKYEPSEKEEEWITRELIRGLSNLRYDSWLREKLGLQETGDLRQFYNYATGVLSSLVNMPEGVCTNPDVEAGEEITFHELMEDLNAEGPLAHSDETNNEDHLDEMLASFWCNNGRHPFLSSEDDMVYSTPNQDLKDLCSTYQRNQSASLHHSPISKIGPTSSVLKAKKESISALPKAKSNGVCHEKSTGAVHREPVFEDYPIRGIEGKEHERERNRTGLSVGSNNEAACRCKEAKTQGTPDESVSLWNSKGPEVMLKELKAANALKRKMKAKDGDIASSRPGRLNESYEEAVKNFEARKSERLARLKKDMASEHISEEDLTKGLKGLKEENILDELSMEIQESLRLGILES